MPLGFFGEVALSDFGRKLLYRIAEHGAGHGLVACGEIGVQSSFVALAGLAQQPADSLVDEVVRMMQQDVGDGVGVVETAVTQELHGADNAYALVPHRLAVTGQVVKQRGILIQQPTAQQLVARQVDKVPVVDGVQMRKVEINAGLLLLGVLPGMLELLYQHQQCCQPYLMPLGGQTLFQFGEGALTPQRFHHLSRHRHLHAQETVALAVLPHPCLEETRQIYRLFCIAVCYYGFV